MALIIKVIVAQATVKMETIQMLLHQMDSLGHSSLLDKKTK